MSYCLKKKLQNFADERWHVRWWLNIEDKDKIKFLFENILNILKIVVKSKKLTADRIFQ